MFLLENKLQSFYEEIKKLNNINFKLTDVDEISKSIDKNKSTKNNSLNTNTNILTEDETNNKSDKSNIAPINTSKRDDKKIEINKIIIKNPNKSKIFNGKNDNETNNNNSSPTQTIIKCEYEKKWKNINLEYKNENSDEENIDDYNLVIKKINFYF